MDDAVGGAPKAPLTVLEEAERLVNGQRQNDYGDPKICLERMAGVLSVVVGVPVNAHQAAAIMVGVKLARLSHDPKHRDTWVDIAGYVSMIDHLGGTK